MMSGQITAEIGSWYQPLNSNSLFEVVAINYDEQSIEIQYFDGDIAEIDFSGWKALIPVESSPPEDWSGSQDEQLDPLFNEYAMNEALYGNEQNNYEQSPN